MIFFTNSEATHFFDNLLIVCGAAIQMHEQPNACCGWLVGWWVACLAIGLDGQGMWWAELRPIICGFAIGPERKRQLALHAFGTFDVQNAMRARQSVQALRPRGPMIRGSAAHRLTGLR